MTHVSMELRELTKEGGTIAAFIDWRNLPAMTDAIQMAGWVWRGVIVWDKGISRNIPGRFRNDCEYIVWGTNGRKEVDWKAAKGAKAMPGIYHINGVNTKQFLSTPSARRATERANRVAERKGISIHALREEGDPPTRPLRSRGR